MRIESEKDMTRTTKLSSNFSASFHHFFDIFQSFGLVLTRKVSPESESFQILVIVLSDHHEIVDLFMPAYFLALLLSFHFLSCLSLSLDVLLWPLPQSLLCCLQ